MKIIAVDDEFYALQDLTDTLTKVLSGAEIQSFQNADGVLEYARNNPVDVAFLDIEIGPVDGLQLARRLKKIHEKLNVIFVTGHSGYALEAFSVFASGYILKPVSEKNVRKCMANLREPVRDADEGLWVRTFGNFEVFYNGSLLTFPRTKAKELFAYLIHKKGTGSTTKELMAVLFENKDYSISVQNQMQTIISTMIKVLDEVNMGAVITRKFNNLAVDASKINCDYYRFLEGDSSAINSYAGEYMANYSWAEGVVSYLDSRVL